MAREWVAPVSREAAPRLRLHNSLTRRKDDFIPLDPKRVTWYACGPTVYDDSHLGHARNYISQDIIRRVMSDYFGYDMNFVMNITDVDDKIIIAARQNHLLNKFVEEESASGSISEKLRETSSQAYAAYIKKNLPLLVDTSPEKFSTAERTHYVHLQQKVGSTTETTTEADAKLKMHLTIARDAAHALANQSHVSLDDFVKKVSGVLRPYLDSLYGSTVKGDQHSIFTELTQRYERRFFEDMDRVNVRRPDKLTRVTEYGPQIVDFVKRIENNGFAYTHDGSVYYDTTSWESSGGVYARLKPESRSDQELQADGEGALAAKSTGFKKSAADFVLWKASKPGEPSWQSGWGEGRPGWHIECSAMASDVLGDQIDIHSGGIDLAFPHHDNELAQSEAYWHKSGKDSKQWVNYFLHMGHLGIAGAKMSKSLKNFTTIKDALDSGLYTPRSLRIIFLLGAWKEPLEISTKPDVASETNKASSAWEEKVNNFFLNVRDLQRHPNTASTESTNGEPSDLNKAFEDAKKRFDDALKDSVDTPAAMRTISELITNYNSATNVPDETSFAIAKWVTDQLVMLGLDADYKEGQIGWSGIEIPEVAKEPVSRLSELRDQVREQATRVKQGKQDAIQLDTVLSEANGTATPGGEAFTTAYEDFRQSISTLLKNGAQPVEFLQASDNVRDKVLWDLGIYLEDRADKPALVRPLSEGLRQERADREAQAAAKAAAAEKRKAEVAAKEQERMEKAKISPSDMFRTAEYSEWDADGLPTKEASGKEVAKSQTKKLKKLWDQQKKLHEEWKAKQ